MKSCLLFLSLLTNVSLYSQLKGASPLSSGRQVNVGQSYAVVVGISDYQDPAIPDLRFADKDAEAFANYLRSEAGGGLSADHLKLLTNRSATGAQIGIALDWLIEVSKENDRVIIYFSGHGDVESKRISSPGYLLGSDAPSRVYMIGGTVNVRDLQDIVSTLSVQNKAKVVLITDACHSGKLSGNEINGAQLTGQNLARQFANEVKILSCQPNEYSIEGEQWGGGRGAFSYHFVNGLYGLADLNNDMQVSLKEVDRYLEDHVAAEVAPVNQNPQVIGNPLEVLAHVNERTLATLRNGKSEKMPAFYAAESKGIEDEVLGVADSSIRYTYKQFRKALNEGRLLSPSGNCAENYYMKLMEESTLTRLHSTITRNYAAALQDDAQQAINIFLQADVQHLECIGKTLKLEPIPQQLGRAAELLGSQHYMYHYLQARKLMFEGILLQKSDNHDEKLGKELLTLFYKAVTLEPSSPIPWHRMTLVYSANLGKPDSAFACAQKAQELAPSWVLPFVDLGYQLTIQRNLEAAKTALQYAQSIDSMHPYIINRWAFWNSVQGNKKLALDLFEKYKTNGGPMYPCWHNDYGGLLSDIGRYSDSEAEYRKAIMLDSLSPSIWNNLGALYIKSQRFAEAEAIIKKTIALDSSLAPAWNSLGMLYLNMRRYSEAEPIFRQVLSLDSTNPTPWNNLGSLYYKTGRYKEAEHLLLRALDIDSTYGGPYRHLGMVYFKTHRNELAKEVFLKGIQLFPKWPAPMMGMSYVLFSENKKEEAFIYLENAIINRVPFGLLEQDEDLEPLKAQPEWNALLTKYFPDQIKKLNNPKN